MLRGVLFDLDDTLYGYEPCNEAALEAICERFSHELGLSPRGFRDLHDEVRQDLADRLRGQAASHNRMLFFKLMVERASGRSKPVLALELFALYWDVFFERMQPAPAAHEVLEELAAAYPLALVSNNTTDIQIRKIRRLGFAPYFTAIVTSEEVGAEKPAVPPFQAALDALELDASQVVMVGDDPETDLRGARALEIRTVLTTEFRQGAAEEADQVVRELGALPRVLATGW